MEPKDLVTFSKEITGCLVTIPPRHYSWHELFLHGYLREPTAIASLAIAIEPEFIQLGEAAEFFITPGLTEMLYWINGASIFRIFKNA